MAGESAKKTLFRSNGMLTELGKDMDYIVGKELRDFFYEWGVPPQEVAAVLHAVVEEIRTETIIGLEGNNDGDNQ
jgi:hypothetical protein